MALNATITWEVRFGGSDSNGGGFRAGVGGTDFTLQDAAQGSGTNLTVDGTTNTDVTPDGYSVTSADVGNVINITAGAGFTQGFYEIVSIQGGTKWRLDRSPAATSTSGGTWAIGGALATPGRAAGAKIAGNDIFIKYNASPYEFTTSSSNVAGGIVSDTTGGVTNTNWTHWVGYDSTRTVDNTDANRPTIKIPAAGVSSVKCLRITASHALFHNIIVDGNSKTAIIGFALESTSYLAMSRCKAINCTSIGIDFSPSSRGNMYLCEASGCSGTAAIRVGGDGVIAVACYAHDNTCTGFAMGLGTAVFCISESNSGGSSDGFGNTSIGYTTISCTAYNNGRDGFNIDSNAWTNHLTNCLSYGNAGEGFGSDGVKDGVRLVNCAGGGNSGGNYSGTNLTHVFNFQALSGDPFNGAGAGDFSPDSTSGEGAACRAAGLPGVMPDGLSTGYLDIGAIQHQDAGGGGGGTVVLPGRGFGYNGMAVH